MTLRFEQAYAEWLRQNYYLSLQDVTLIDLVQQHRHAHQLPLLLGQAVTRLHQQRLCGSAAVWLWLSASLPSWQLLLQMLEPLQPVAAAQQ